MSLEFHESVHEEVESTRLYLNGRSQDLGDRFLAELKDVIQCIVADPTSFPLLETLPANHSFRRAVLKTASYLVIFEPIPNGARIVAVGHSSRRPNYWLKRRHDF